MGWEGQRTLMLVEAPVYVSRARVDLSERCIGLLDRSCQSSVLRSASLHLLRVREAICVSGKWFTAANRELTQIVPRTAGRNVVMLS